MVQINWTDNAIADLLQIKEYISKDSEYYALKLVSELLKKPDILKKYPEFGTPVQELSQHNFRQLLHKSYKIFYQFRNNTIFIISLHHTKRLLENNPSLSDFI